MATNKSLKNDLKDMGEKIVTNFNILDSVKDESDTNQEAIENTNKVKTLAETDLKQDEAIDEVKDEALIENEEEKSMNIKIFKRYMELCSSTGLMPSWLELDKFKKYYLG
jgi:predicted ribosome quality control (RQC) complex YloA/Tae2 family protein